MLSFARRPVARSLSQLMHHSLIPRSGVHMLSSSHRQRLNWQRPASNQRISSLHSLADLSALQVVGGGGAVLGVGTAAMLMSCYKVAAANEYLVRTGIMIDDIEICKQAFHFPFQTLTRINMHPITYNCLIEEAMSHERISFNLPTVFTVGPEDKESSLKIYSKLIHGLTLEELESQVLGVIRGETRMAVGKMKLDDLFNNKEEFKANVVDQINHQLQDFGLTVYNANIEEMTDMVGNEYFVFLRKRALESAVNRAKVDVAEQMKFGNVGERMHDTETRQKVAEYEMQAELTENDRSREIAESQTKLIIAKAEFAQQTAIAQAEATAAADLRQLELQQEVEKSRLRQSVEKLRASEYSAACVAAEVEVRRSEGLADAKVKEAEGKASAVRLEAEASALAIRYKAEAEAVATKMLALARFVEQENVAKGILKVRQAEAEGLESLIAAAGGVENLCQYLMVRDGILTEISKNQAEAVRGMNPQVSVWQTGAGGGGSGDDSGKGGGLSGVLHDIASTSVPLLDGIKRQYGIDFLKHWRDGNTKSTTTKPSIDSDQHPN